MKIQEEALDEIILEVRKTYPDFSEDKIARIIDSFWRMHRDLTSKGIGIRYLKTGKLYIDREKQEKMSKAYKEANDAIEELEKRNGIVSSKEMEVEYYTAFKRNFANIKPLNNE